MSEGMRRVPPEGSTLMRGGGKQKGKKEKEKKGLPAVIMFLPSPTFALDKLVMRLRQEGRIL
jgi:hypothetical protein